MRNPLARVRVLVGAVLAAVATGAAAQAYPQKPVRIIVPFPPGGAVDTIARVVASRLSDQMGQQFIVENRAGANGSIGSDAVAKAAADGYTLLVQASTFVTNPLFLKTLPYDIHRDFTPITNLGSVPLIMAGNTNLAASNLAEFLAQARRTPDRFTFGAPPLGSAGHMALEAVRHESKLGVRVVSYKGTAPVVTDLLGGHITATMDALPAYFPHIKAGKMKGLAVSTAKRLPSLPDVPTVAESGLPGFDMVSWYGLWGPARLPADLTRRLSTETTSAIRSQQARDRLSDQGFEPVGSTPEEFGRYIVSEQEKLMRIVKAANITGEGN